MRLDDPDTKDKNEASDLGVGFSTLRFDKGFWLTSGENEPMRYMIETTQYEDPSPDPVSTPHFLAYGAPQGDNAVQDAIIDSYLIDVDEHDVTLDPGEYRALQWIFTQQGTYKVGSHLEGFVRGEKYKLDSSGADWKPISSKVDETSDVKQYVFQVGSDLNETEPPLFELRRSLKENSPAGTNVGKAIPVRYEGNKKDLKFGLIGEGAENFTVTNEKGAARIKVAPAAILDLETCPTFDLILEVWDGLDHEGNVESDPQIDHRMGFGIDLTNVNEPATVSIIASNSNPSLGEQIEIRAVLGDVFNTYPGTVTYIWRQRDKGASQWTERRYSEPTWTITDWHHTPVIREYDFALAIDDGTTTTNLGGSPITVTWGNPPSN